MEAIVLLAGRLWQDSDKAETKGREVMENCLTASPSCDPLTCADPDSPAHGSLSPDAQFPQPEIMLRQPRVMDSCHWHGHLQVNVPFGGDVEYLINGETLPIKQGHVALFWACVPHRLTRPGCCRRMAIFHLPMHLFLSWSLPRDLVQQVTHGCVVETCAAQPLSDTEVQRWERELRSPDTQIRQLAIDEVGLMMRRFSLCDWRVRLTPGAPNALNNGISRHGQFYVSQMLEFIAANYHRPLAADEVARYVRLNAGYAAKVFRRVMQLTMRQYITAMRINHLCALLSDSDRSVTDIARAVGFRSASAFYRAFQCYTGMTPQKYRQLSQTSRRLSHAASPATLAGSGS
nr:transcriptional regulator MelR [Entomohabitans teleogrylli]